MRFFPKMLLKSDYVLVEFFFQFGTIWIAQHGSMSQRPRSKLWEQYLIRN